MNLTFSIHIYINERTDFGIDWEFEKKKISHLLLTSTDLGIGAVIDLLIELQKKMAAETQPLNMELVHGFKKKIQTMLEPSQYRLNFSEQFDKIKFHIFEKNRYQLVTNMKQRLDMAVYCSRFNTEYPADYADKEMPITGLQSQAEPLVLDRSRDQEYQFDYFDDDGIIIAQSFKIATENLVFIQMLMEVGGNWLPVDLREVNKEDLKMFLKNSPLNFNLSEYPQMEDHLAWTSTSTILTSLEQEQLCKMTAELRQLKILDKFCAIVDGYAVTPNWVTEKVASGHCEKEIGVVIKIGACQEAKEEYSFYI